MLLAMATALKVAAWQQAGIPKQLGLDLPSPSDLLTMAHQAAQGNTEQTASVNKVRCQLLRITMKHFTPEAAGHPLFQFVATDHQGLNPDELANLLAELLWQTRAQ